MTLVGTIGFPDEVLIVCDSRRSYENNILPPKDDVKKIYQLSHHLCVGFTTQDISFTSNLIKSMTVFSASLHQLETGEFLKNITIFAKKEYESLAKKEGKSPDMILVYAGMDEKPLKVERNKVRLLIKLAKKPGYVPEKIKNLSIDEKSRYVEIPAPTPLLAKQRFPSGKVSSTRGWDFTVVGSGFGLENELEKFYTKFFFFPGAFNKGIILSDQCSNFVKNSNIGTIGGTIQIFFVDKSGVKPVQYIETSGGQVQSKIYIDQDGDWVEEKNGKVTRIKQNP